MVTFMQKRDPLFRDCVSVLQRPVVVTCSHEAHISLSAQVILLRLEMQRPTSQVLLEHLVLVSVCENVGTNPGWLAEIVHLCRGDLR